MVGNDANMKILVRIILPQKGLYGIDDDAVLVISGIEDEVTVLLFTAQVLELLAKILSQGRNRFLPKHGHQCEEQNIGTRSC